MWQNVNWFAFLKLLAGWSSHHGCMCFLVKQHLHSFLGLLLNAYSWSSGCRKGFIPKYQYILCEDTQYRCYSLGKLQLESVRATAWRCLIKPLLFCKYLILQEKLELWSTMLGCFGIHGIVTFLKTGRSESWLNFWLAFFGETICSSVSKLLSEQWLVTAFGFVSPTEINTKLGVRFFES